MKPVKRRGSVPRKAATRSAAAARGPHPYRRGKMTSFTNHVLALYIVRFFFRFGAAVSTQLTAKLYRGPYACRPIRTTPPRALLTAARQDGDPALGRLLQRYRAYLSLLAQAQIGRHLRSRVDDSDVVQETFLAAHRDFKRFRGTTEAEFVGWLRNILAARLADLMRRHVKAKAHDARLEKSLAGELDRSSQALAFALAARAIAESGGGASRAGRAAGRRHQEAAGRLRRSRSCCAIWKDCPSPR